MCSVDISESLFKKGLSRITVVWYAYIAMVVDWDFNCTTLEDLSRNIRVDLKRSVYRVIENFMHKNGNSKFYIGKKILEVKSGYGLFFWLKCL